MQVIENDRIEKEKKEGVQGDPKISYYIVAPGVLKTAFANYPSFGKDAKEGAEAVIRLLLAEDGTYPAGSQWEFEEGEMRIIPW